MESHFAKFNARQSLPLYGICTKQAPGNKVVATMLPSVDALAIRPNSSNIHKL